MVLTIKTNLQCAIVVHNNISLLYMYAALLLNIRVTINKEGTFYS